MINCKITAKPAKFAAGQKLLLSPEQIKSRAHNLIVPKNYEGKRSVEVTTKTEVEFKAGETVGVPMIPRSQAAILIPIETEDSAKSKAA